MKKAIAAVSFGTSFPDARLAIEHIETRLMSRFYDRDFFRAFTSGMITRKIAREEGIVIPSAGELAEQLLRSGYTDVLFQSLHIIAGSEYEKFLSQIAPFVEFFERVSIGKPLLYHAEDYAETCRVLLENMPPEQDGEAVVFMGHGSEHPMNAVYSQLENTFRTMPRERVYVGTVEGFPELDYIVNRLRRSNIRRVHLAPLMIVSGEHAKNDLAGKDADSWVSQLTAAGFEVAVNLLGIGEYDGIAELIVKHAEAADNAHALI